MKIDENCINHNVARIADILTENLYEFSEDKEMMALTLAEIKGACTLAHDLKVVLKQ